VAIYKSYQFGKIPICFKPYFKIERRKNIEKEKKKREIMRLSKNFYNLIIISYKIIPKNLKIGEIFMKREWKEYNKQLVKRGEVIIDEDITLSNNRKS
jgi:hypothetical protein